MFDKLIFESHSQLVKNLSRRLKNQLFLQIGPFFFFKSLSLLMWRNYRTILQLSLTETPSDDTQKLGAAYVRYPGKDCSHDSEQKEAKFTGEGEFNRV